MAIIPVKTLVRQAKDSIKSMSVVDVQNAVARDEVLLIDIRDIRELERDGRIQGAFHAPRGMLEFWIDPESPYHKPELATEKMLVLFCASAWRSALSVKTLQDMGLTNVAELEGGFKGWRDSGAAIET